MITPRKNLALRVTGVSLVMALAFTATTASADDDDYGYAQRPVVRTVGEVLKNPVDDRNVRLEGKLLRRIADDTYLFSDGTGEIRVELDDDDDDRYFRSRANRQGTFVIHGEIDRNRRTAPEIDVDDIYQR